MSSFSERVNAELRAGRGQVVDGYSMPESHRAANNFIRQSAAANTWETTPDGTITHIDGHAVEDRGEGRGEGRG